MTSQRCCCDDGGGPGGTSPFCGSSGDFTSCVYKGEYLGLEIISASYTGQHFSQDSFGRRFDDDYTLSLISVTQTSQNIISCPNPVGSRAIVFFDALVQLDVQSSACSPCTGSFPSSTQATMSASIVLGCKCGAPFTTVFNASGTTGALFDSHGCLPFNNPRTEGTLLPVSNVTSGTINTPCGTLTGSNYVRFKVVGSGLGSIPPAHCSGDIVTTAPTNPFYLDVEFNLDEA